MEFEVEIEMPEGSAEPSREDILEWIEEGARGTLGHVPELLGVDPA